MVFLLSRWLGILRGWATDSRGMAGWQHMVFLEVLAMDHYSPACGESIVVCIELVGFELYAAEYWCDCQGLAVRKMYYRWCHCDGVVALSSMLLPS